MVGGRGWDNQDYLGSLSGDEEDREKETKKYEDFSASRAAHKKRQEELLKNCPQAQAFLQQRQQQQDQMQQPMQDDGFGFDGFDEEEIEEGSGGGTRMARMMAQAKRMQGGRNPMAGGPAVPGFQQKLIVPLEFDKNASDDED
ncbi:MAG: hypothetical protein SGARI_007416, partial [Bacillariaceae sp.]